MSSERRFAVQLGERGKLVIPAPVRKELGLEQGTPLTLTVSDDGTITLVSRAALVSRLEGSASEAGSDLLASLLAGRQGSVQ